MEKQHASLAVHAVFISEMQTAPLQSGPQGSGECSAKRFIRYSHLDSLYLHMWNHDADCWTFSGP